MKYTSTFILCFVVLNLLGQNKKFPLGISADYQFLDRQCVTLELSVMSYDKDGKILLSTIKKKYIFKSVIKEGYGINAQYIPKKGDLDKDIYGFRVGGFGARNYMVAGFQVGYYTDMNKYKICFIPEIGLGYKSIFIVYGRNIRLYGDDIGRFNKDNLSVRVYIPIGQGWLKK